MDIKRILKGIACLCLLVAFTASTAQTPLEIAEGYMRTAAKQKQLELTDIVDYKVSNSHVSALSKLTHTYLQQQYQGIPIYNAVMGIHVLPNNELLMLDNQFLVGIDRKINTTSPRLSPIEIMDFVVEQMDYEPQGAFQILENIGGSQTEVVLNEAGIALEPIRLGLIYQAIAENSIRLCWKVNIVELGGQNWWNLSVDALTGEILHQENLMISCNFEHGEALSCTHDHHSATIFPSVAHEKVSHALANPDSYRAFDFPLESPNHGASSLIVNPANSLASPFGWHDTNGIAGAESTETRGNNVNAQEDHKGDNGTGYAPDGGVNLDFDFALDPNLDPCTGTNLDAAITNLFVWNNYMHDIWYQYGFDEASGNFQENNYGKGGLGGDRVNADAQDGSGTNNATFGTPSDGSNPRMSMFLWGSGISFDLVVNSPANIVNNYDMVQASFGATNFIVTGNIVEANDGSANPSEACNALTTANAAAMNGNIALIDRGNCEFGLKSLNAQNAGAIAVIVCQNSASAPFSMGPGTNGGSVTIPAVMVSQATCATIRNQTGPVNVTMDSNTIGGCSGIDGDFDNGIVAHEYGHGISTRLTGGAGNSSCLSNQEQMGEGWSDWFGLMLTIEASDVGTDGRGIGTFAQNQSTSGPGIRPFRYSTDMGINPHTYADISSVSIPHGVGSVWCMMIWEMAWTLIDEFGFDPDLYTGTGGNNIAMALVIEGLKLQPCNPGFVDGRDAILAADQAIYGGAHTCLIWEAFAKRGLGFGASQGNSNNVSDSVESFNLPPTCLFAVDFVKTVDKDVVKPGEVLTYSISATNNDLTDLTLVSFMDVIPANTTYVPNSASDNGVFSNGLVEWTGMTLAAGTTLTRTFSVTVDPNLTGEAFSILDDMESPNTLWSINSTASAFGEWVYDTSNPFSGTTAWFANDVGTNNENNEMFLTLSEPIFPTDTSELTFQHYFDTEEDWDGGRVQYSTDGSIWTTFEPSNFTANPYNGILDNNPSVLGFSGLSGGGTAATYIQSTIDLGFLAGNTVYIRFWMHLDPATGGDGWYIDDILIDNIVVRIPNTATMDSAEGAAFTAALDLSTLVFDSAHCNTNENITGIIPTGTYQVSNVLSSDGFIESGNTIVFQGNTIDLKPDFQVAIGGDFLAEINPCSPLTFDPSQLIDGNDFVCIHDAQKQVLQLNFTKAIPLDALIHLQSLTNQEAIALTNSMVLQRTTSHIQLKTDVFEAGTYFLMVEGRVLAQKLVLY